MTATEFRQHISECIQDALSAKAVTVLTYHGLSAVALVPLHGVYGLAISKAIREADNIQEQG